MAWAKKRPLTSAKKPTCSGPVAAGRRITPAHAGKTTYVCKKWGSPPHTRGNDKPNPFLVTITGAADLVKSKRQHSTGYIGQALAFQNHTWYPPYMRNKKQVVKASGCIHEMHVPIPRCCSHHRMHPLSRISLNTQTR